MIYEPEYAIKNDDGIVWYHRPKISQKMGTSGGFNIELNSTVGKKQTVELLENLIETIKEIKVI